MVSHQCTGEGLLHYIRGLLEPVRKMEELISVPNLLLSESWLADTNAEKRRKFEDTVLGWFKVAGFDGDRSRNHFFGDPRFSGYPGLLRTLESPPPWVDDITMEECEGDITEVREGELRPLYLQVSEHDDFERKFENYFCKRNAIRDDNVVMRYLSSLQNERFPEKISKALGVNTHAEYMKRSETEEFRRLLHLVHVISPTSFPQVLESIIDTTHDDECGDLDHLFSGVPDLLLWTKAPLPRFWFFAEVSSRLKVL